ncbi:hypothetical protein YPPY66_2119 [Yersinia pestis PY-66]|uniref:Uncharacterized protein n=1 Tax=Yersinia pseudotuberculosis serotype O:1b (strain IP 31758) TaxID=349747 RepID=A0A0U1R1T1_YERP3|nr:hypothetical protein YpsIP31758_1599 [Yersinia pseudotuberculosis IP 31758]ADV98337.1 hypothetical protein YPC_1725 [Yersinia pestis biovar Medievalis str. Harbin 35]EDR44913.1 hypothetical protein YpE1979001_1829 [Yersinia pestis biovar Antiqua str. E1979001]EDR52475.1 hypothetical protein YpB42003004_1956 [Yersinia pestis biovar Antiqua str. B42003004]EDR56295.1 hypothetical protein YpMG051020_1684 [Yersinia pestis biovar Orientalis str. MG05-1020]EDR64465.1 hypothetical protein YpK197300
MIEDNKGYSRFMEPLTVYISGFYSKKGRLSVAMAFRVLG